MYRFAVILCFDVKVDKEAQDLADELGIKIFKADIIYHLFDQFTAYNKVIFSLFFFFLYIYIYIILAILMEYVLKF